MEISPIEKTSEIQTILAKTVQPSARYAQHSEAIPVAPATKQESPSVSAAVPEPSITAETSPQDSMRIAALLRKEKQLRKLAQDLQGRERKIQEIQSQYEPWKEASNLASQNKLEAIKKLGITYDDLTQQVLNGGNLPPEVIASQKAIEAARAEIEAFKKEQADAAVKSQQAQYESAIKQIDSEVEAIASVSDKFLLVKETGAYHDVTEYIEKEFHKTGRIIPVVAAMEKVEQELLEGFLKVSQIEKIKSQLFPQREEPKIEQSPQVVQAQPKIQTLTHRSTVAPASTKAFTAAERKQRAIDAFYGRS